MFALTLSGCGGNNNTNNSASETSDLAATHSSASAATNADRPDNSKEVKLTGFLIGEAPKGLPEVLAAINEKLKKDINATLEINYIGWGDVASKYPLVLASGQDVDFIFAADWNYYISEANKGSFMPLNENMLQTYMPKYFAKQDPAAYKATIVNGKQYMIPTTTPDRKVGIVVLRKDILDRSGLENPTNLSELGPYFAELKKNHPEMTPLNLDSQYDLAQPFNALVNEKFAFTSAPIDSNNPSEVGTYTDSEDPAGRILSLTDEPVLSSFKYAAGIMKQWYDAGYVNKNPFANKVKSADNFLEGKAGVAFGNSLSISSMVTSAQNKGIETYIMPTLSPTGKSPSNSWLNNGVAIAANSANPERTLQALDLLMEDESYVNLAYYGIEGKNYITTADGKLGLPEGVNAENNSYPPDASGFWFVDKDFGKPSVTWPESYIELQSKVKNYLAPPTYLGFTFNTEKVKSEMANLKTVSSQYYQPIVIGGVKDVNKAFETLESKMKAAGIDKVKAEVEAQAAEFLKNRQ
ncbi:sugar ABC transporter substrate-binding protein [Paenibacillus donghaensis]|uniref:Sugar ABC transporter substrate-binding protein n=2 Tax=Paenibacillus donghaensis TaxID=414771 RepID=A0A2Z2KVE9_9BACL|nr:sugar ABC transporter substrate-binding protein [Paenibacillus donghaensis]